MQGRGLYIGGLGGKVTIAGGIGISGTVSAASNNVSATALRLGAGATTPLLHVTGTVQASGSSVANTIATAVAIDENAVLPGIRNAGTIKATAAGENGTAIAILDMSNSVSLIENSGAISATGAKADSGRNVALELSDSTINVTVYYDSNFNFTPEINEGIIDVAVVLFDNVNGRLLAFGNTNQSGTVRFENVASSGSVRVQVPLLNYSQIVGPGESNIAVRVAPLPLPIGIP